MVATHSERRRPALTTVGRGARGLLGFWNGSTPVVIAGTAIARTENKLHVLALNKEENAITSLSTVDAPAEVWSLDIAGRNREDSQVLVAARRGCDSFVEVWQLKGLPDLHTVSAGHPDQVRGEDAVQAVSSSSLRIEGDILKVCRNQSDPSKSLCVTQTGAFTLDTAQSLKQNTSLSVSSLQFSSDASELHLVSADWIDASTVLLASQKSLGVFDARTGSLSSSLNVKKILESCKPSTSGFWIPPHPSRLASACSDSANVVYAGSQNGWLRAFDIRTNRMFWEAQHAQHQRVSAVGCAPGNCIISGGMDGVVKCWSRAGEALATFPQHDDTLTNISSCTHFFATVSYDGRVAINEVPIIG